MPITVINGWGWQFSIASYQACQLVTAISIFFSLTVFHGGGDLTKSVTTNQYIKLNHCILRMVRGEITRIYLHQFVVQKHTNWQCCFCCATDRLIISPPMTCDHYSTIYHNARRIPTLDREDIFKSLGPGRMKRWETHDWNNVQWFYS